jgi:hypothetical protein
VLSQGLKIELVEITGDIYVSLKLRARMGSIGAVNLDGSNYLKYFKVAKSATLKLIQINVPDILRLDA